MSNIVEINNQVNIGFDDSQVELIKNTVAKGATNDELEMFMYLATQYNLDPFKKEIWFMKFGGQTTITTSRDGYLKYAQLNPEFEGLISFVVKEGDTFEIDASEYKITHRFGTERGKILGAWARCDREGKKPFIAYVDFDEYNKKQNVWNSYPSAMIQKVAECYTEGAEILTERGFIDFSDLTEDDVVAQVNDSNKLSFIKPLAILKKKYKGDIIAYDSAKCKMEVTLNHRVVTTEGIVTANELYKNLRQRKFPHIPRSVYFEKQQESEYSDEELILAGYMAADGSRTGIHGNIQISVSRKDKIERIRELYLHQNTRSIEPSYPGTRIKTCFTYSAAIGKKISKLVDMQKDKTINTDLILSLGQEKIKLFIDALLEFDGSSKGQGNRGLRTLYSSRFHHIKAVEVLAVACGYSVKDDGYRISTKWTKRPNYMITLSSDRIVNADTRYWNKRYYEGNVYCVEVPTGKIVVRQGGYSFIGGNCFVLKRAFGINGLVTKEEMDSGEVTESVYIGEDEARTLFALAERDQLIVRQALDEYGCEGSSDVTKFMYENVCNRVIELVQDKKAKEDEAIEEEDENIDIETGEIVEEYQEVDFTGTPFEDDKDFPS